MNTLMNYIGQYPYKVLWVMAFPIFILGYLLKNRSIDIQIHDTYYVLSFASVGLFLSLYAVICGFIYFLFRNQELDIYLVSIHFLSIILLFVFWMANTGSHELVVADNFYEARKAMKAVVFGTIIFCVLQLLFLVNLVISFFRN